MLKKNDFIDIEYTGTIKEEDIIFDTTYEKVAKDNDIYNPKMKYGTLTVCLGQGQLIQGLDSRLEGKEIGEECTFDIPAAEAFGKKDAKMIQLISTSKFRKADINPVPGLQVNIDDQIGIVKTVSGGRTLVDFNHPLSGKNIIYKVKIVKKIDDIVKKTSVLVGAMLQIEDPIINFVDGKASVDLAFDLPPDVVEVLIKKIKEVLPELKEISFKKADSNKKKEDKPAEAPKAAEQPKPVEETKPIEQPKIEEKPVEVKEEKQIEAPKPVETKEEKPAEAAKPVGDTQQKLQPKTE